MLHKNKKTPQAAAFWAAVADAAAASSKLPPWRRTELHNLRGMKARIAQWTTSTRSESKPAGA